MSKPEEANEPLRRGPLGRVSLALDNVMRTNFFRLGYLVAGHPWLVIVACLVFTALCLAGLARFRTEKRGEELWVPQNTLALSYQDYAEDNYGQAWRISSIAFTQRAGGVPLASRDGFFEMLKVAKDGYEVVADGKNGRITHEDRCVNTTDANGKVLCTTVSAFNLFYDPDLAEEGDDGIDFFESVRRKIDTLKDEDIRKILENPPPEGFDGSPFNAEEIIGGKSGSGDSFSVNVLVYSQIAETFAVFDSGDLVDEDADDLEETWTKRLLETTPLLQGRSIDWYVESIFSRSDALEEALTGDIALFSAGFVLLAIYVILFLGDFHMVRSHMLLAVTAIVTNGLALAACFGISSLIGMFFGPVHQILPLLILGIGIDDCFHVTRAGDEVNWNEDSAKHPVRLRVALALSRAGTAITVTSFTNVAVFLLSAISELPALRFFALWAAIGIFFAWAFTITFFTACMTLEMRRIDANRRDCCPCFPPLTQVRELNVFRKKPGGFSRFFGNYFGPFIMRPVVRFVLLLILGGFFAACCYGTSQLYLKFKFSLFFPDGTPQKEFSDIIDDNFFNGDGFHFYVRDRDLSSQDNQLNLLKACNPDGPLGSNRWVQADTIDCWYVKFREEMLESGDIVVKPTSFLKKVKEFTEEGAPGQRYFDDLLFNGSELIGCRVSMQYVYRDTNDDEVDSMKSVRDSASSVGFGNAADGNPAAFPYSIFDVFTEQFVALPRETGLSLGLASVAVALVCFFLVGHPLVALVCVVVVGVIIIDVLGLTHFSEINLNSISVITLVLCTGISVDFVVHVARSFLEHVGTRKERAIKALETMGPPVFYAGFSTLLAIIVLAGAESYVFRVLFRGFLFLILAGFVHGLVLCPIILSFIGPKSFYVDEEDKERVERELEERVAKNDKPKRQRRTEQELVEQVYDPGQSDTNV